MIRSVVEVFRRLVELCRRFLASKNKTEGRSNKGLHHSKRARDQIKPTGEHFFEPSACLLLPRKCGNECRKGLVTVVAGLLNPSRLSCRCCSAPECGEGLIKQSRPFDESIRPPSRRKARPSSAPTARFYASPGQRLGYRVASSSKAERAGHSRRHRPRSFGCCCHGWIAP